MRAKRLSTTRVHLPEGYRQGDRIEALHSLPFLNSFGIAPSDVAVMYHTQDVCCGDLIVLKFSGDRSKTIGTTVHLLHENCGTLTLTDDQDFGPETYSPAEYTLRGRIVHVERGGKVIKRFRPIRTEAAERIEVLRAQLSRLDYAPENEACYFRLESEIWKLEHPAEDDDSILNAELISGRGFGTERSVSDEAQPRTEAALFKSQKGGRT